MSNYPEINRWKVLVGAVIVLFCTGAFYTFSVFANPLAQEWGVAKSEIMLAFTISTTLAPIPTIIGGRFTDKGFGKWTLIGGGVLFSISFFLAGFLKTPMLLGIIYGVLSAIGLNFAYSAALSNTLRLFPDKKGLAAGLITAGMGLGTSVGSPIAAKLIAQVSVSQTFMYMGIFYFIICLLASFLVMNAPADYKPANYVVPKQGNGGENVDWKGMLRTPKFYLITSMLGIGAFSGLMISSNASPIGQTMYGLNPGVAAFYVSVYALSNVVGRVLWGTISDKIGRAKTILIIYVAVACSLFVLSLSQFSLSFPIGIIGLGLCFGGVMGVFPSLVMENFGTKNQGVNYGVVFTGFSLAALFAPRLTASIAEANQGNYSYAFYIAIGLAFIGIFINFTYQYISKTKNKLSK